MMKLCMDDGLNVIACIRFKRKQLVYFSTQFRITVASFVEQCSTRSRIALECALK